MTSSLAVLLSLFSITHQANIKRNLFDDGLGFLSYPISLISDQDKGTKDADLGIWFSTMISANLHISKDHTVATVDFLSRKNFTTMWNYNGRAMELSDLKMYNGKLLTVDDKTGIMYMLQGKMAIPWVVFPDSDGLDNKPFKGEWIAVKDKQVYCGGYGKEMTTVNGTFISDSPFWIKVVNSNGGYRSEDWKGNFIKLREHMDIHFPGYMIHESAQWSNIHRKWFFLPRHMSKLQFTDTTVHTAGANVLLMASEDFSNISHVFIGATTNPTRGFSAFQFVPGTNDEVVVALKSVEVPGELLTSYLMVFNVNGTVLLGETEIEGNLKCEGVEFYDSQLGIYPFTEYAIDISSTNSFLYLPSIIALIFHYV